MLREQTQKKCLGNEVKDIDGISGATTPYVDMTFGMGWKDILQSHDTIICSNFVNGFSYDW